MTTCFLPAWLFLACKTTQELPVTQLASHVDLFHLVITDNQRPDSLSLPHGLAPAIKPTTHFQPNCLTLSLKRVTALQSGPVNLSFPHMACYLFSSALHLVPKPGRGYRMLQLGLLPWPSCPALSWTQTAELTPRASGLWISDLTSLPAFPSIIGLSLPRLSTWPTPQVR
jgi:hypothetical protein